MTTVILLAAGAILTVGAGVLALCAAAAHADRELEDEPWKGRTMTFATRSGHDSTGKSDLALSTR